MGSIRALVLVLLVVSGPVAVGAAPAEAEPGGSCVELDEEIALLLAQTYADRPVFYDDPRNAVAFAAGIALTEYAFLYWVYAEARRAGIRNRIVVLNSRIETLRRAKARQHCFESH